MKVPDHPHRRFNPLNGEWVLVSPHRTDRPWQGSVERTVPDARPSYDPKCYLCPGNERAGGERNPDYKNTFAFTNDFAALLPDAGSAANDESPFRRWQSVSGTSRVICFSPRHDLTLSRMDRDGIRSVVDLWAEETQKLGETYRWVQVFENRGEMMGASNPHPHGQIWASDSMPNEPAKEDRCQLAYHNKHGSNLLLDLVESELTAGERRVVENSHWAAFVPFWAVWPFETILIPKRHVARLPDLSLDERNALADILRRLLVRYDNIFEMTFPYTMGWHGAPSGGDASEHWQLHAHFYPPLLRSATVRKFMVGYEMLAEPQRDISPERAAALLREVSEIRFEQ